MPKFRNSHGKRLAEFCLMSKSYEEYYRVLDIQEMRDSSLKGPFLELTFNSGP